MGTSIKVHNIEAASTLPKWNPQQPVESLEELKSYVVKEAVKAIEWYWEKKRWIRRLSRFVQFAAIILAAAGGLSPIGIQLLMPSDKPSATNSGLWASLFAGMAAALVGLDRAFGFSSGWARFVLTGTAINKALGEFAVDWAVLSVQLDANPTPAQLTPLLQRAKEFITVVQGHTLQETKDWVAEFQSNMAQLEKDVNGQLERLRSQAERAVESKEIANRPGSLDLTVPDADKTDGFTFEATLDREAGQVAKEIVKNDKSWVRLGVPAGHYKLTITANVSKNTITKTALVEVKTGEVSKVSVSLL